MSIDVTCKCGKAFRVKDEYAGKKGKCPKCGHVLLIPEPIVELEPEPDEFDFPTAEPDEYGLAAEQGEYALATGPGEYGLADMLDEELAAPPFPGAGPSSSFGGPAGGEFELRVQANVPGQIKHEVERLVDENLRRHFALADASMRRAFLEVQVFDWDDDPEEPGLAISVAGTVANAQINRAFRGTGVAKDSRGFFGRGKKKPGSSIDPTMRGLLEDTLDDVCLGIDKAAGGSLPPASQIWSVLTTAQLVVSLGLGFLAAHMVWDALPPGKYHIMLVMGLPFVITMFLSVIVLHGICVLFMPDSFFTRDPRGRRILQRFNARTPGGLRMTILGGAVAVCAMLFFGYYFVQGFIEGYNEASHRHSEAEEDRPRFTPPDFDIPRPDLTPPPRYDRWGNPRGETPGAPSRPEEKPKSSSPTRRSPFPQPPGGPLPPIPGPGPGFGPRVPSPPTRPSGLP